MSPERDKVAAKQSGGGFSGGSKSNLADYVGSFIESRLEDVLHIEVCVQNTSAPFMDISGDLKKVIGENGAPAVPFVY